MRTVSVAATTPIASHFGPAQRTWVERVEKRVAVTAGMLGDMKAVKMLGLSNVLKSMVLHLRELELKTSEKFRSLLVYQILVGRSMPIELYYIANRAPTYKEHRESSRNARPICYLHHLCDYCRR